MEQVFPWALLCIFSWVSLKYRRARFYKFRECQSTYTDNCLLFSLILLMTFSLLCHNSSHISQVSLLAYEQNKTRNTCYLKRGEERHKHVSVTNKSSRLVSMLLGIESLDESPDSSKSLESWIQFQLVPPSKLPDRHNITPKPSLLSLYSDTDYPWSA